MDKIYWGEYVAPEINVMELQVQGVLCQSGGDDGSNELIPGGLI